MIVFRGCVGEVVVPSCAVGFIYITKKMGSVSFISVQDDVRIKSSTSWPDGRIRVCAHQTTLLSLLKCLSGNSVSSVCVYDLVNSHNYLS